MHPLRVLLVVSLGIAAVVASAFFALLVRGGASRFEAAVLSIAVFAAFLVPWSGVYLWAIRRASSIDALIDRTRIVVERGSDEPITDASYHGELDELARAIDAVRELLAEQRSSFAEYRAAVEQIVGALGEGLMAIGPEGRVVFANERVSEMFGGGVALAGRSILEIVRKRTVIDAIEGALHGRRVVGRVVASTPAGERHIEIRAVPVTSSSEIAAVALFIDVSDVERLQRIRSDFLDDFSHEIRTPLAGLRTAVETFDAGQVTTENEEALRHVMRRQIERIERLVRDIAELNRIESGDLILEKRKIDVREVVDEVVSDVLDRVAVSGGPAVALVDPHRLEQILSNLLDNASKHGGGEIAVEIAKEDPMVVVRVSDNGEGIPPADLERIFNRFYRVDRSRSQSVPGAGLGLSIAKHLVLLHGGTIRAFNRPAGGASFEVRIPAA